MLRLVILRFLESYFRHRWLWLLPIVLMIGLAGVSVARTEPYYISRGAVYVQKETLLASLTALQSEGFSWVTPAQSTTNDIKELMQTDAFIRAVIQQTDLESEMSAGPVAASETINAVRTAVWVQPLGDNLVQVGAIHDRAAIAHQLASGVIEAYLRWKINEDREESTAAQTFFADLIVSYRQDLDAAQGVLEAYLLEHPDPARGERSSVEQLQIDQLEAAVELAAVRLKSALDNDENTRLSVATSEGKIRQKYYVIDSPRLPDEAENSLRGALINSLIFVVVGAILSVIGVAGGALIDRTYRFPVDVVHTTGLPVIAILPDTTPTGKAAKPRKERPA